MKHLEMKKLTALFLLFLSVHSYAQKDSLLKPTAGISGLTKGTITMQQFKEAKEISVSCAGCVVTSYRLSAYARDKDAFARDIDSNIIPADLKEAIAEFPSGTRIYFEYIKAVD